MSKDSSRRPDSLTDKLKALGVKVGTSDLVPPDSKSKASISIETVIDGRAVDTRAGETFVAEQIFPADYHHGRTPLGLASRLEALASWAQDPRLVDLPLEAYAFLDTETSGLAGGTGTYAFLVGVGRYEGRAFRLAQFFMRDPTEESALLEGVADFLAPAQALVTFNGKAFDAPLLKTRYRLHRAPVPFEGYLHLDLLPLARRLWRDRLPSRALKYLEENILGAPRSMEEVSGWEIPYLYFDYLRSGDATPLKGVFYHNAMDVVAMAALLYHVSSLLAEPHERQHEFGQDVVALAKLFEDLGKWDDAARLYERSFEMGLPEPDFWQTIRRLSILQRRRGDLEAAVRLWEKAAAEGNIYAHIELAKYFEHRRRDPVQALQWASTARDLAQDPSLPVYVRRHWQEEIEHRLERLKGKIKSE
ncbi:MAG: ribonuclease H-like domain-containing protein [Anaerolineales bacterium]|jgi:uncharacterized protein YprB with RNaseH-like and TPR domain